MLRFVFKEWTATILSAQTKVKVQVSPPMKVLKRARPVSLSENSKCISNPCNLNYSIRYCFSNVTVYFILFYNHLCNSVKRSLNSMIFGKITNDFMYITLTGIYYHRCELWEQKLLWMRFVKIKALFKKWREFV